MPRAFTQDEQDQIRNQLKRAGRRLFAVNGVVGTSLDQLVGAAGIAKGSFYKFYDSKELLYMDLLEESQNRIRGPLLSGRARSRKALERLLTEMFEQFCEDPMVMLMGREVEFNTIMRRVPRDYLLRHKQDDQLFLERLNKRWNSRSKAPQRDMVAARMTMLVMLGFNRDLMGAHLMPFAVDAAVKSLADCYFG